MTEVCSGDHKPKSVAVADACGYGAGRGRQGRAAATARGCAGFQAHTAQLAVPFRRCAAQASGRTSWPEAGLYARHWMESLWLYLSTPSAREVQMITALSLPPEAKLQRTRCRTTVGKGTLGVSTERRSAQPEISAGGAAGSAHAFSSDGRVATARRS